MNIIIVMKDNKPQSELFLKIISLMKMNMTLIRYLLKNMLSFSKLFETIPIEVHNKFNVTSIFLAIELVGGNIQYVMSVIILRPCTISSIVEKGDYKFLCGNHEESSGITSIQIEIFYDMGKLKIKYNCLILYLSHIFKEIPFLSFMLNVLKCRNL